MALSGGDAERTLDISRGDAHEPVFMGAASLRPQNLEPCVLCYVMLCYVYVCMILQLDHWIKDRFLQADEAC